MTSSSSRHSSSGPSAAATGFPFQEGPAAASGPETVINPEGRNQDVPAVGSSQVTPGSSVWNRLFPSAVDEDVSPQAAAGFTLEHFVIEQRIGVGGMGAVFRALDQRLQRVVALKILGPAASRDPSSVSRFQNEARAAARLDHDGIARVFYIGFDQGLHFIAYEYIVGSNIRDLIRVRGQIDPAEALHYTMQIAIALRHTTAAGIVHRDIKPSNVIVTRTGVAKLVDLGLARKDAQDSLGELTLAGTTLGTFDYIAPEQARDPRTADVRSDIYSLGCTLYHMLTGEAPYPEGTVMQKLLDHQGKEAPNPALKNPRVPQALTLVVQKMMASDPRKRYSTPDDLIHDLLVLSSSSGLRPPSVDGSVWSALRQIRPPFWERHLGWMITAAALLAIVALLDRFPSAEQVVEVAGRQPAGSLSQPADASDTSTAMAGTSAGGQTSRLRPSAQLPLSSDDLPDQPIDLRAQGNPLAVPPADAIAGGLAHPPRELEQPLKGSDSDLPEPLLASRENPRGRAAISPPVLFDDPALDPLSQKPPRNGTGTTPELPGPVNQSGENPRPATASTANPDRPASGTPAEPPARQPETPAETAVAATTPGERVPMDPARTTTDSSAAQGAAETRPVAEPADERAGTIALWTGDGSEPRTFRTLEAACEEARDGSVIELNFSGARSGISEKPVRISGKEITIRAGRDMMGRRYRPLVRFVSPKSASNAETRMFTVIDGSVNLINLDLELVIEQGADPVRQWSLLSLQGPQHVGLQGVNISVVNPGAQASVCIAELVSAPGRPLNSMGMMNQGTESTGEKFEIELTDSFVRGRVDFAVLRHTQPGKLRIEQSALAISGTLLRSLGDLRAPDSGSEVELQLGHVTCALGEGLVRIETGDVPQESVPLRITARNNIIASAAPTSSPVPVIGMAGSTDPQDFRQKLHWSGQNNFYDRFPVFWTISSTRGTTTIDPIRFEDWKRLWASLSSTAEIAASDESLHWLTDWRDASPTELSPADLALDDDVERNPAISGATDGTDAGADLSRLPELLLDGTSAQDPASRSTP